MLSLSWDALKSGGSEEVNMGEEDGSAELVAEDRRGGVGV